MRTTIDDALEILKNTGPEFTLGRYDGLSNHGAMGAETLLTLGRDDTVISWVEAYKRRLPLRQHPEPSAPISAKSWREALGDFGRAGDWTIFFDRELEERAWRTVLDEWVGRLAPGFVGAGTHGIIRTAHAVRSIAAEETAARRHELAEGLGYWAARFQPLPGSPGRSRGGVPPSQGIRQVEPLREPGDFGLISDELRSLDRVPAFRGVIDIVDVETDASSFLSDLTETFARVYLANVERAGPIGMVHAVTGPSAVRLMMPHLRSESVRSLLRYAWQAAAAMYVVYGETAEPEAIETPIADMDDLIERATDTADVHAIKFTEACLREFRLNPAPVYLSAAADASRRLRKKD